MKIRVVFYFLVPILIYVIPFVVLSDEEETFLLLENYVYYAFPLFLWSGVTRFFGMGDLFKEIGYLLFSVYLVVFSVAFYCCVQNPIGMNWIYYQLLSVATGLILWCYWHSFKSNRNRSDEA